MLSSEDINSSDPFRGGNKDSHKNVPSANPLSLGPQIARLVPFLAILNSSCQNDVNVTQAPERPTAEPLYDETVRLGGGSGNGLPGSGIDLGDVEIGDCFKVRFGEREDEVGHRFIGIQDKVDLGGGVFVATDGFGPIENEGLFRLPSGYAPTGIAEPLRLGHRGHDLKAHPESEHLSWISEDRVEILDTNGAVIETVNESAITMSEDCELEGEKRVLSATEGQGTIFALALKACGEGDEVHRAHFMFGQLEDNDVVPWATGETTTSTGDMTENRTPRDSGVALTQKFFVESRAVPQENPLLSDWTVTVMSLETGDSQVLINETIETPQIFREWSGPFGMPVMAREHSLTEENTQLDLIMAGDGEEFYEQIKIEVYTQNSQGEWALARSSISATERGVAGWTGLSLIQGPLATVDVDPLIANIASENEVTFPVQTWIANSPFGSTTTNTVAIDQAQRVEVSNGSSFTVDEISYQPTGSFLALTGLTSSYLFLSGIQTGAEIPDSVTVQCELKFSP